MLKWEIATFYLKERKIVFVISILRKYLGFKFALWNINRFDSLQTQLENGWSLWTDSYKISSRTELVFFTQYERDIDKFKPSYSGFVTGLYRQVWLERDNDEVEDRRVEEWETTDLDRLLHFMKKHPFKSYVYVGSQRQDIWEEVSGISCFVEYVKDLMCYTKRKIREWFKLKRQLLVSIRLVKKTNDMYHSFVILKPEGWYPRISIVMRRIDDYDYDKCLRLEEIIDKFDDKWFNKISLDQYDLELSEKKLTKADKKEDEELKRRFIERLSYNYADQDSDYNIIRCNCEELVDIKAVK